MDGGIHAENTENVKRASSLYNNKIANIHHEYTSMHFQLDGLTLACSVGFIVTGESLQGQLVNSQAPEKVIYLCMFLHTRPFIEAV